ncbi:MULTISPECIES: hypothetical protein [Clavibacter]|uniref:Uncharacterized protein n=2 Tax=Clavibacter TaxID=1573 RepID=A0A399NWH1_9MICO|nr:MULTISPECIES: hypothetical protein [Clavibacter]KDP89853.1 hypothetical protein W824_10010 [Clavibacter cf. michiganensis LMG 26808]RII98552.1 hypothetical protein DZF96_02510 [Clavibacter michiganensis]UKF24107.1 hypothetical protein KYT88_10235 [Clavibacter sp. A6099]
MTFIWVTRGRTWGFRVLRTARLSDAFESYETAFAGVAEGPEAFTRVGDRLAIRFPDPEGRRDRAGRVISHEFVLLPPLEGAIDSVEAARDLVWPQVEAVFRGAWDAPQAPAPAP